MNLELNISKFLQLFLIEEEITSIDLDYMQFHSFMSSISFIKTETMKWIDHPQNDYKIKSLTNMRLNTTAKIELGKINVTSHKNYTCWKERFFPFPCSEVAPEEEEDFIKGSIASNNWLTFIDSGKWVRKWTIVSKSFMFSSSYSYKCMIPALSPKYNRFVVN